MSQNSIILCWPDVSVDQSRVPPVPPHLPVFSKEVILADLQGDAAYIVSIVSLIGDEFKVGEQS
jgi:hypothetical protein